MTTLISDLDHPWDVVIDPAGTIVTDERGGRIMARFADGRVAQVRADLPDLQARGEGGLMGMALARDFATTRSVYTCFASTEGDVRVVRWTAAADWSAMTRADNVLIGIPLNPSGRHSGCRILPAPDGTLYVATGDTADPIAPQSLSNLGGKILHVDSRGAGVPGNIGDTAIHSLGHRNPQGMAFAPGTDRLYTSEHGPTIDDEINLEVPQGNYGWDPDTAAAGYDEDVPMTDTDRHPGSIPAVWSSGRPTLAVADIDFLGPQWGPRAGMAVVATLKASRLMLLRLRPDGRSTTERVDLLAGVHGRLRSITTAPDGALLVTTDNGDKTDSILRVAPRS
ncbi:PQQ-dependent sugar dehydrogenase [Williamsia sp. CHRR-6]|uniref:PQQ-dependent sugar dehydrogenase n=1 Tax=Williamsia sp. CHRR-6 TaxID=2835871 RepID=UPI0027DE7A3D|nr:PQQ-dependent sugar dehydrogenase [Williamsia sp. CHRR-6]